MAWCIQAQIHYLIQYWRRSTMLCGVIIPQWVDKKILSHAVSFKYTFYRPICFFINFYLTETSIAHDDVIKWKHFPRHWPVVWRIHRSPLNFPHKGQRRGALMLSLICAWTKDWVNSRDAGDLRHHRAHYDVTGTVWNVTGEFVKFVCNIWVALCMCSLNSLFEWTKNTRIGYRDFYM